MVPNAQFKPTEQKLQARRAIIYIRVSSDPQAEIDRASLPEQEAACRRYCEEKGYSVGGVISDIARRWDATRPGFQRLLNMGKEKPRPFDVIVVWRADRIVGSASTVAALEPLLDGGVDIEGAAEPVHKQWLLFNALISKGEIEAKKERGKLGTLTAINRRHWPGPPPYGRRKALDGWLELDPVEAERYRAMFQWTLAGWGDRKIAQHLNSQGIPTRYLGRKSKGVLAWRPQVVQRLLTVPAAWGDATIKVAAKVITVAIPGVVERETFEAAQRIRAGRRDFGHRKPREPLLLCRRVYCAGCGRRFRFISRSTYVKKTLKGGETRLYPRKSWGIMLICRGQDSMPNVHMCRQPKYLDYASLKRKILCHLEGLLVDPNFTDGLFGQPQAPNPLDTTLASARVDLQRCLNEMNWLITNARKGLVSEAVLPMQVKAVQEELDYWQERVAALEAEAARAQALQDQHEQLRLALAVLREWAYQRQWLLGESPLQEGAMAGLADLVIERADISPDNDITLTYRIPLASGLAALLDSSLQCQPAVGS